MIGLQNSIIKQADTASPAAIASALTRHQASAKAADASGGTGATNGRAPTGSAQITSNDFLTLLVSELKNQDPTQPTDPNAYIQQLVGVNSLQQLIQINQGLAAIEPSQDAASAQSTSAS